jgi:Flp pilus assembly pilin Flp
MLAFIRTQLARLRHESAGLTTVEYVIVLSLIAVVGVGTWQTFGDNVKAYVDDANTKLTETLPIPG